MATIHYARLDEFWRKEEKYAFMDEQRHVGNVAWQPITPDKRHTWLTEGMQDEFETFLPIGAKESKDSGQDAIFINYGRGVATGRDCWVYNFDHVASAKNTRQMIEAYNDHVRKFEYAQNKVNIDEFVSYDDKVISWSESLKLNLQRRALLEFSSSRIRQAVYRPFTPQFLYFDQYINERRYQMPSMFPLPNTENRLICVTDKGSEKPFMALATNHVTDLHIVGAGASSQCFPFYTYDEDGANRRENITDWAIAAFRHQYATQSQSLNLSISQSPNGIFSTTSTPSSTTPTTGPTTPPTCGANCRGCPLSKIFGALPRLAQNWRRCMWTMNSSPNIVSTLWKPRISRSTGGSNA